ncbi:MAG TPA: hemolysin family protein [Anaerolineales bacterium]|nr:hemolysin family protein [Anaerolineales bacterium]
MADPLAIAWLLVVLALDALVVAARASLMNAHAPTLEVLQEQGVIGASLASRVASEASRLLFATGGAMTLLRLTSLGLSWAALGSLPLLPGGRVAAALAGGAGLLGIIEAVAGRSVLRSANAWAARLSFLAAFLVWCLSPVQRLLAGLLEPSGESSAFPVVTEAEIKTLVDAGEEGGAIEEEEKEMIYSIFRLGDTLAREVMIPRIDMQAFEERTPLTQVADGLLATGHSRAPVYRGSIDRIVGLVYAKDMLSAWRQGKQDQPVGEFVRPAVFVPEAKKADDLLAELQSRRIHAAIVVDEYGGTAGMVTVEDILEEIVGEIRDEYDVSEEAPYQQVQENEFIFSGRIDLDDVNQVAGSHLPKDRSDTLAGFIYGRLGRVPTAGDAMEAGGLRLVVERVAGRRIEKVRARRLQEPTEEVEGDGSIG